MQPPAACPIWRLAPYGLLLALTLGNPLVAHAVSLPSPRSRRSSPAIDAVISGALADGTVIDVEPGTYVEALRILNTPRSLTIRGVAGAGSTVINAVGNGPTVSVKSASGAIRFEALTLTGGSGEQKVSMSVAVSRSATPHRSSSTA